MAPVWEESACRPARSSPEPVSLILTFHVVLGLRDATSTVRNRVSATSWTVMRRSTCPHCLPSARRNVVVPEAEDAVTSFADHPDESSNDSASALRKALPCGRSPVVANV
ncbi:Uncharacterised protein [Mycobacteroides abscessus]|nr:Uncharacterised protein [Mycobacteroides abscessus]